MSAQGRLGDKASITADVHGCLACPHPGAGPAIAGSPDVLVNRRPALRVDDVGIHAACCGTNRWRAQRGAETVFINGKPAFRVSDPTQHCGGQGQLIEGSPNVFAGDEGNRRGVAPQRSAGGSTSASPSNHAGAASGAGLASSASPASGASPANSAPPASSASPIDAGGSSSTWLSSAGGRAGRDLPIETTWLGFTLRDEGGHLLAGERWELTASDRSRRAGVLDGSGAALVEALPAGPCRIRFPDIDDDDIVAGGWIEPGRRHDLTARHALVRFVLRDDDGDLHVGKRYELEVEGEISAGTTGDNGVIAHRVPRRSERGELRVWLSDEDCRRYRLRLTRARAS